MYKENEIYQLTQKLAWWMHREIGDSEFKFKDRANREKYDFIVTKQCFKWSIAPKEKDSLVLREE